MTDVSEQKFLEVSLQEENQQLKLSLEKSDHLGCIVGKSEAMRKGLCPDSQAAETETNVIIYGETGCGRILWPAKSTITAAAKGRICACKLRGHTRKPAGKRIFRPYPRRLYRRDRDQGRLCGRGTQRHAFLDEIGELPINLQVKFLRVLESKTYTPLGGNTPKSSRFRLVAATNRNLGEMVRKTIFGRILLPHQCPGHSLAAPAGTQGGHSPLCKRLANRNGIELRLPHSRPGGHGPLRLARQCARTA